MRVLFLLLTICTLCGCASRPGVLAPVVLPEQRTIAHRRPDQFASIPSPSVAPPRTVTDKQEPEDWFLSLDDAIRIGLENARVVRVLTGLSASSSGRTIYDPAIMTTGIDQEQGRFDPVLSQSTNVNRVETGTAAFDPLNPGGARIIASRADNIRVVTGMSQTNLAGGQLGLNWIEDPTRFAGGGAFPLNPQNRNALEVSYTQPLLQGGGRRVNMAPIVLARLNTEASFFQYKDSVQELVRGIIEAYWNLVQARIDVWARGIQVQQSEEAFKREKARFDAKLADVKDVAQSRVTYTQFKANLIAAEASVLAREGALRNLLGLPPNEDRTIIPVSAPTHQRLRPEWNGLVSLAEERRPDIIELKLIIEAEQVRLLQAENLALPRVDATALYRWNGVAGAVPSGERLATGPGQLTDWTVGINFSVPLGLRQGRAKVREVKLLLLRDRANLEQGLHAAIHELAASVRALDSAYEQYLAYKETRKAANDNLKVQIEQFRFKRSIYLNVLQALNDWGNAVTSEAAALLIYNITLANLEKQSGTILDTHGLVFNEERFRAAGPLGIFGHGRLYPAAVTTLGAPSQYPATTGPSEDSFDLRSPVPQHLAPASTPLYPRPPVLPPIAPR